MRDPQALTRLLLYGRPETRRRAALHLLTEGDPATWQLLADTVRSVDPWLLRARALEALGTAAGSADERVARHILAALLCGEIAARAPVEDPPSDGGRKTD